jgi:uncharacterized membrane protein
MRSIRERISFSQNLIWFSAISVLTTVGALVTATRETVFPLVYLRYVFGFLLISYLPGSSLVRSLFPTKEIFSVESIALSMATSLGEVSVLGLVLHYTDWGITQMTISRGLLVLTLGFAIVAVTRTGERSSSVG